MAWLEKWSHLQNASSGNYYELGLGLNIKRKKELSVDAAISIHLEEHHFLNLNGASNNMWIHVSYHFL